MAKKLPEKDGLLSLIGSIKDPSFFESMEEIIGSRSSLKSRKAE